MGLLVHRAPEGGCVRSGFSATSATNDGSCSSAIRGGGPPPIGSGVRSPRSRSRRSRRETDASPTSKRSATCAYVRSPFAYRATIRRRRSKDNGVTSPVDQIPSIYARENRCRRRIAAPSSTSCGEFPGTPAGSPEARTRPRGDTHDRLHRPGLLRHRHVAANARATALVPAVHASRSDLHAHDTRTAPPAIEQHRGPF